MWGDDVLTSLSSTPNLAITYDIYLTLGCLSLVMVLQSVTQMGPVWLKCVTQMGPVQMREGPVQMRQMGPVQMCDSNGACAKCDSNDKLVNLNMDLNLNPSHIRYKNSG